MSEIIEGQVDDLSVSGATEGVGLKKNAIGLPEVLFQAITAMAPAAAVSAGLTLAYGLAGASVPLAVMLATIACGFIAASIGQLAVHIPSAGGMYTYISRALGAKTGFLSAWVFLIAQPLLLSYVALIWGPVTQELIKTYLGIDIHWIVWTLIGSAGLVGLTYFGIRLSANASIVLGAIEILILLALSTTMIFAVGGQNDILTFTPIYSTQNGWVGLFQAMIFAFLIFVGFETAAPLGEETTNPKRNIPRAVVYSAIGIGIFYMITTYASVVGWGIPGIGTYVESPAPWVELSQRYWGTIGPVILSFAIINSALGNGNAGINATSRVAYAMGRIGTLPAIFARLSKYQTPGFAIIVQTTVCTVIALGCYFLFDQQFALAQGLIGTVLTLGLLALYFACCVATIVYFLREKRSEFKIWHHVIVPVIPMIILLFVFQAQIYPVPPYPMYLALPILGIWLVFGLAYMIYLMRSKPAALERGKEIFLKDLEI